MQTHPLGLRHIHLGAAARGHFAVSLAAMVMIAVLAGCRRDPYVDAYFEMLNTEKRVLEDRLYDTQYNYEQALAELEALRGNTKDGRKPATRKREAESERPLTGSDQSEPREQSGPPEEAPELPKIELPPGVEEGKRRTSKPAVLRPASAVKRESPRVAVKQPPLNERELAAAVVSALDQRVESISLNPRLTGGADFDGQPGDDGICVLVEPRNRSGDFVPEPARVAVVLLDPAQTGDAARIARWDLDADVAGELLHTDSLDRGLLLRLPWQTAMPEGNRAHLFVRYVMADGRKVEADREIEIESADRIAQSWTPRRTTFPEAPAGREMTAGWQPPLNRHGPEAVQTAAELPATPMVTELLPKPTATELLPKPAAAPADDKPTVVAAPNGRFWKPER